MNDETDSTNPDYAQKVAAILSIRPDDARGLTQFSPGQRQAYEWAVRWLHDFNLGRMPRPHFCDEVLGRLSDFYETKLNEQFRQKSASASADQRPEGVSGSFVADLIHNLNTHRPYEPRGQNVRNCQQPEYTLAEPLPPPPADDPLAAWSQRALAGMKRMAMDPEHRASIGKRVS